MTQKYALLKQYFGYDSFLGGQEPAVDALLAGRDLLAVMPTGAGKSLCFQLPALCLPGITLVISPLISLMADQVMALKQMGVPAAYLNSSLTERQFKLAMQYARQGRYKLIYVAPERLHTPLFLDFARHANISMIAVDEAHCVSQWGQDFRPRYLSISAFVAQLPQRPPVGAFTATATPEVQEDIIRQLALQRPERITTGFDRPKLRFIVRQPKDKLAALRDVIASHPGEAGVVYCATRKNVEEVCEALQNAGLSATRYHAGLEPQERRENQDDFLYDRRLIMVATNAFGMGIDKSNVRYVVHYNMPLDLESYYQEAGRAGRDGGEAECILLYAKKDVNLAQFLLEHSEYPEEMDEATQAALKARDQERLKQMVFYSTTPNCLRQFIMRYFGQPAGSHCGNCSNCLQPMEQIDETVAARVVVAAARELEGRFGRQVLASVVRGKSTDMVERWHLKRLRCFGALSDRKNEEIMRLIDDLLADGYLESSSGEYPTLHPGPRAELLHDQMTTVTVYRREEPKPVKKTTSTTLRGSDGDLYQLLRALRTKIARKEGLPPFMVFSDKTLQEIARLRPTKPEAFLKISGVGKQKLSQYGDLFMDEVRSYEGSNQ